VTIASNIELGYLQSQEAMAKSDDELNSLKIAGGGSLRFIAKKSPLAYPLLLISSVNTAPFYLHIEDGNSINPGSKRYRPFLKSTIGVQPNGPSASVNSLRPQR
jgi:hypothetical protein